MTMISVPQILQLQRVCRLTQAGPGWMPKFFGSLEKALPKYGFLPVLDDLSRPVRLAHVHVPILLTPASIRRSVDRFVYQLHVTPDCFLQSNVVTRHYAAIHQRAFIRSADAVIAPSRYALAFARQFTSRDKTFLVPFGIDLEHYANDARLRSKTRTAWGVDETDCVILMVGAFDRRKGRDLFLRIAAQRPEHTFVWAGGGSGEEPFGRRVYRRLLKPGTGSRPVIPPNVKLLGYVDDTKALYSAADVFLCTSSAEVGVSVALLEAAACGLPLLARVLPCYKPELVDEDNCLLAPDEEGFLDRLDELIEQPGARRQLGESARRFVAAAHGDAHMAQTFAHIYRAVLAS